ncbi:MAG: hypothetical protein JW852_06945 [Spirochaetales bacterium]|nr:hypothetical protein [Spirochaetales bacterium]
MKRVILVFMLVFAFAAYITAQSAGDIEFTIRYYDKAIYFPDSNIFVRVELYNNTADTYRFKVSPERVFNLDFEVRTVSNEQLQHAPEFIIKRASDQPVLYREYSLEPGERYAVVDDITRYISIRKPGVYTIRAIYYPELSIGSPGATLTSNALTLSVQPGSSEAGPAVVIDRETGEALQPVAIPPDEVIDYMLTARQKGDWNKFFLYIDLEALYLMDRAREESYKRSMSDTERRAALSAYRRSLMAETTADELLLTPFEYQIIKTSYTPTEASVIVIEKFAYPDYTEVKQYTYYLEKRDSIWLVTNYEIRNLGTE